MQLLKVRALTSFMWNAQTGNFYVGKVEPALTTILFGLGGFSMRLVVQVDKRFVRPLEK